MPDTASPLDEQNSTASASQQAALPNKSDAPTQKPIQQLAAKNTDYRRCPINPWTVGRFLGCIITVLILGGAAANYAIYNIAPHPEHQVADVLKRFDLGHEPSIPAFYSAIVMLLAAGTAGFLSVYDGHPADRRRNSWRILALVLVLLAIDEVVMFHEMGTAAMEQLGLSAELYFSWVIPGGIFAAIVAISFTKLLINLGWRTRLLFLASGAIFVAGAIGMELLAGVIFAEAASELDALSSVAHVVSQAVEEGLEMIGMALFLCTLLDYINLEGISVWVAKTPVENRESLDEL
jgi:hypothetical protein